MRAALDLADAGLKAYLVEQTPGLGGRVAQLGYMFPPTRLRPLPRHT